MIIDYCFEKHLVSKIEASPSFLTYTHTIDIRMNTLILPLKRKLLRTSERKETQNTATIP